LTGEIFDCIPTGEGYDFDFTPRVEPKIWVTISPKGAG
jgi:hypothetical protein